MINPNLILSVGTQRAARVEVRGGDGTIALPPGAVGVVAQAPADYWHSYRVQFLDGVEASLKRDELAILSEFQTGTLDRIEHPMAEHRLWDHVIYRCVIGSRAYGLNTSESDIDRRGVYLPPADIARHCWPFAVAKCRGKNWTSGGCRCTRNSNGRSWRQSCRIGRIMRR
ncbi:MAG: nucleotidyltransferase domain-containing protein [Tepidisphaeraceae bacterium]|jgi:hypothetical protein